MSMLVPSGFCLPMRQCHTSNLWKLIDLYLQELFQKEKKLKSKFQRNVNDFNCFTEINILSNETHLTINSQDSSAPKEYSKVEVWDIIKI